MASNLIDLGLFAKLNQVNGAPPVTREAIMVEEITLQVLRMTKL
jgi:hypothetical protein